MGSSDPQLCYAANAGNVVLTIVAKEFEPIRGQSIAFIRLRFKRRLTHAGGFTIGQDQIFVPTVPRDVMLRRQLVALHGAPRSASMPGCSAAAAGGAQSSRRGLYRCV